MSKNKCHQQKVNTLHGILYIRHSFLESTEKSNIFSQMYPILGKDDKLLSLLIKHGHITDFGTHRSNMGTQAEFMRGYYGVFYLNYKVKATEIVHACVVCRKVAARTYTSPFKKYARLTTDRIFSKISIDFLGPFLFKAHISDRKTNKFYVLVVACISTGAVAMYLLDSYSTLSAVLH